MIIYPIRPGDAGDHADRGADGGPWQAGAVRETGVDVVAQLRPAGGSRGGRVGLAVTGPALGLATGTTAWAVDSGPAGELAEQVARIDRELRPRWVMWSGE